MGRANKAEFIRSGAPVWDSSGDLADWIERLDDEGQPWILAYYPVRAKFVAEEVSYCYELVIFQTYDRDMMVNFTTDKYAFFDIVERLGLKLLHDGGANGKIYGRDNTLRDLRRQYEMEIKRERTAERSARERLPRVQGMLRIIRSRDRTDMELEREEGELKEILRRAGDNHGQFRAEFNKKHKLITYKIF